MGYTWEAVSLLTGESIAELPSLVCDTTSAQIGQYTTTTATLPLTDSQTPPNWQAAVLPGASALIQVDEDGDVPIWGGFVTRAPLTEADEVSMSLISMEGYFDRRYVGDLSYAGNGQNLIVADLVTRYAITGNGVNGGIPLRVVVLDGVGTGRDRTYADSDNKTLYSVLTELSGVQGGPEWTITWEVTMVSGVRRITPVLTVGSRIGSPVTPGLSPAAVFYLPGNVTAVQRDGDYSAQSGANDVMAYSTADGDVQPQSAHVITPDAARPVFEYRWSPSTSISDTATLDAHASAKAALMGNGSDGITISGAVADAPKLGTDWRIGDDIGYDIRSSAFPHGLTGTVRAVGWELKTGDLDEISPILLNPDDAEV